MRLCADGRRNLNYIPARHRLTRADGRWGDGQEPWLSSAMSPPAEARVCPGNETLVRVPHLRETRRAAADVRRASARPGGFAALQRLDLRSHARRHGPKPAGLQRQGRAAEYFDPAANSASTRKRSKRHYWRGCTRTNPSRCMRLQCVLCRISIFTSSELRGPHRPCTHGVLHSRHVITAVHGTLWAFTF